LNKIKAVAFFPIQLDNALLSVYSRCTHYSKVQKHKSNMAFHFSDAILLKTVRQVDQVKQSS